MPTDMLGRVFSRILSAQVPMTPMGLLASGPVIDALGVQFWLLLTGLVTLCAGALGFTVPGVRQLEKGRIFPLPVRAQPGRSPESGP
jgi:hypothetical protein